MVKTVKYTIKHSLNRGGNHHEDRLEAETHISQAVDGCGRIYHGCNPCIHGRSNGGNHDDVYGKYTSGDTTTYYVNKVAPAKVWNKLHRSQANDFRRVFGGDGTYFYLDNVPQKIRFICLNSQFYEGEAITSGTTKFMTTGFGTEQLAWLRDIALSVDEGWNVVIATHVSINATDYLNQYSDGHDFTNIIDNSPAPIIAIFSGHAHRDAVFTSSTRCPNVIITCAINSSYDSSEPIRTLGTDTETAIDIVTINKKTRTINTTRLGVGSDRSTAY